MATTRRGLLKVLAAGACAATAAPLPAEARTRKVAPEDAVGLLYDTTLCIGCKTCTVACKEANGLTPDTTFYGDGLYDAPETLNERTKTTIHLAQDGDRRSYFKRQCMHCVDPACVGACMIGALQKREYGVVTWDGERCIGCRYCQMVCPFNVPKFEWSKAIPKVVKCELCIHRLKEGKEPGCTTVCPRQAVVFGKRADLLAEAHRRLAAAPEGKYVPKVYGESEVGGTQCLVLSHLPFETFALPTQDEPVPELQQSIQHGIYQGFAAPVALFAVLGAVAWRNRRAEAAGGEG